MPHITIEFSVNTCSTMGGPTDIDGLVDAVHDAVIDSGLAPVDALRTRAVGRNHVAIADRHADNRFIAVVARIGPGRSSEQKKQLANVLIDAVEDFIGAEAASTTMLSSEVQEIDAEFRVNRNGVRDRMIKRNGG